MILFMAFCAFLYTKDNLRRIREREVIMANWSKSVLTHEGIKLINSTISGGNIEITSVKSGSGSVPVVDLRDQTELQSVKQTLQISKIKTVDGVTTISAILANLGLTESYGLQQIGIYAADGDNEILFAISQADNPTTMPTETETPLYSIAFNFSFILQSDVSMTVTIDSGSLVSLSMLYDMYGNVDNTSDIDKPVSTAQQAAINTAVETLNMYMENLDNAVEELNAYMGIVFNTLDGYMYSKNIINYDSFIVDSAKGTLTVNSDGSVTLKNITSSYVDFYTEKQYFDVNMYTFSVKTTTSGVWWMIGRGDTILKHIQNSGYKGSYTYDNQHTTTFRIGIRVPANSSVTAYVQCEVGSEATPFMKKSSETVAEVLTRLVATVFPSE